MGSGTFRGRLALFAMLPLVALLCYTSVASAQLQQFVLFRNADYAQNSSSAPTSTTDYYFSARDYMLNPTDFDGATMTYPGPGSPVTYGSTVSMDSGGYYLLYQSGFEANKAAIDADFPMGIYTTTATNSATSTSQTTPLTYGADAYPLTIPALTASGYQAIQNLNVSAPATINFSAFSPDPSTTSAYIFFDIYDSSNTDVFDQTFLSPGATSVTIPANTLLPGTAYTFRLIFSDRVQSLNPSDGIQDLLGFDSADNGAFTTAVPEPASLGLLVLAGAGVLARRRGSRV